MLQMSVLHSGCYIQDIFHQVHNKLHSYPPGNDHISPYQPGTFESMNFPFPVWWDFSGRCREGKPSLEAGGVIETLSIPRLCLQVFCVFLFGM